MQFHCYTTENSQSQKPRGVSNQLRLKRQTSFPVLSNRVKDCFGLSVGLVDDNKNVD